MFWRVILTLCMFPTSLLAGGGASPYANSSAAVIFHSDGTHVDCSKAASKTNARVASFKRQFTQVTADQCLWSQKINQTDLQAPATFYRVGVDVSCTLEETMLAVPIEIANDQFAMFLQQKGFGDVQLESSATTKVDGKEFTLQQLRGRVPEQVDKSKPLYRVFMWFWADAARLVTFKCLGPADAVSEDELQIIALSSTLRITQSPPN